MPPHKFLIRVYFNVESFKLLFPQAEGALKVFCPHTELYEKNGVANGRLHPLCRHLANWTKRMRRL